MRRVPLFGLVISIVCVSADPVLLGAPKTEAPLVEAGTVIADFSDSYDAAVERYTHSVIRLKGAVTNVNVRTFKGKTFVDIQLGSSTGDGPNMPIDIGFKDTFADQVGQLKVGDLVEIHASFGEFPAAGGHAEISEFIGDTLKIVGHAGPSALRDEMVKWITENNSLGPDSPLVTDMTKLADAQTRKHVNFKVSFGPGLMKSGNGTIWGAQDGAMYALELTPAQCADLKLPRMSAGMQEMGDSRPSPSEVALHVKLDTDSGWAADQPLTGVAIIQTDRDLFDVPADYAVRLSTTDGGSRQQLYCYAGTPKYHDTLKISFGGKGTHLAPGPHIAIFQFVRMHNEPGEFPTEQVISLPQVMMVEVK